MISRVVIVAFLLSVVVDSIAAVAPQMNAEECSARCCQAARQNRRGASLSKLRCLVDCNQSGAANTASSAFSFVEQRHRKFVANHPLLGAASAPTSPAAAIPSKSHIRIRSTDIYLRTGTLLI